MTARQHASTARHRAPRRRTPALRTALTAAAGSVLVTTVAASAPAQASATTAPHRAASAPTATRQAPDSLRRDVNDLTVRTPDGSALGQARLFAVYRDLRAAGVNDWTVVGAEDPGRPGVVLRLWHTDPAKADAVRRAIAPTLRVTSRAHEVYSVGLLAPVRPGSPAARGDVAELTRVVQEAGGPGALVDPQPDVVHVHLEADRLSAATLDAVRAQAARTAGSPVGAVRVIGEP
ncbi:hypothetical protein K7472_01245 [Streptomyces sp. PTM05]|uniref:Secreted protein n=1 Tax=Streptantibioticus parmotrematis TaxID=2873249 RepID=A0ABS7QM58_9ACTN|nr:hypothetical protein [Streptantibioticus parmotrematis]MBY8883470.1 hypothetical protein [Streptantibioticus parmotrematis]